MDTPEKYTTLSQESFWYSIVPQSPILGTGKSLLVVCCVIIVCIVTVYVYDVLGGGPVGPSELIITRVIQDEEPNNDVHLYDDKQNNITSEEINPSSGVINQENQREEPDANKLVGELVKKQPDANELVGELVGKQSDTNKLVGELVGKQPDANKLVGELVGKESEANKLVVESVGNQNIQDLGRKIESKNKTKVLLLTYMRGGSSLLGEMFNQNPNAIYWFEPLDGVYSDMYGTKHGWFPPDILYDSELQERHPSKKEEQAILSHIENLFSCRPGTLTTDTLASWAMNQIIQNKFQNYVKCLDAVNKGTNKEQFPELVNTPRVEPPWYCKAKLIHLCPRSFTPGNLTLHNCWYCIHSNQTSSLYDADTQINNPSSYTPDCNHEEFARYSNCMVKYRSAISPCVQSLTSVCDKASLVSVKTIRLRAEFVEKLMTEHPDLKVIHQLRDPRAMTVSRASAGLLSLASKKDIVNEATLLCRRILSDLNTMRSLTVKYPRRILQVQYEDLVTRPLENAERVYQFLGKDLPGSVIAYFSKSSHADHQGGPFETQRTNGTESLYKWRKRLAPDKAMLINEGCAALLDYFKYPL